MEKYSDKLLKVIELCADLELNDIYDLKKILDEDIEQIEKYRAFNILRNAILITENNPVDSVVANDFVKEIMQTTISKYGVNEVFTFISKTRDEIDTYKLLDKLYQLPQVANEHDLPKDELKERIGVREKYIELKEKYENEFGTAFPSGVYLDFTRHKHNIL